MHIINARCSDGSEKALTHLSPSFEIQIYIYIYICYLPAGRSVLEKYFVEVSKTVFETETKYFSVRTNLNGKYLIYFLSQFDFNSSNSSVAILSLRSLYQKHA